MSGGTLLVHGTLASEPPQAFAVDFHASPALDASEFGEGQRFLGATIVTTDAARRARAAVEKFWRASSPPTCVLIASSRGARIMRVPTERGLGTLVVAAEEQDARAGALGFTGGRGDSFEVVRGDRLEPSCTAG